MEYETSKLYYLPKIFYFWIRSCIHLDELHSQENKVKRTQQFGRKMGSCDEPIIEDLAKIGKLF